QSFFIWLLNSSAGSISRLLAILRPRRRSSPAKPLTRRKEEEWCHESKRKVAQVVAACCGRFLIAQSAFRPRGSTMIAGMNGGAFPASRFAAIKSVLRDFQKVALCASNLANYGLHANLILQLCGPPEIIRNQLDSEEEESCHESKS